MRKKYKGKAWSEIPMELKSQFSMRRRALDRIASYLENNKQSKKTGYLFIIVAMIMQALVPIVYKFSVHLIDPSQFALLKTIVISMLFYAFLQWQHQNPNVLIKYNWKRLFLIGMIGSGLATLAFLYGLNLSTATNAAVLIKLEPVFALGLGFFLLKEKISRHEAIGIFQMLLGSFFLITAGAFSLSSMNFGDLLLILVPISWATSNFLSKSIVTKENPNIIAFGRNAFAIVILFLFSLYTGSLWTPLNLTQVLFLLLSATLAFLFYIFWFNGIKRIKLSKATALLLPSVVITTSLDIFFFQTSLLPIQLFAIAVILLGAFIIKL
jgi:drug/metabolite transporter (DMT)-like permease